MTDPTTSGPTAASGAPSHAETAVAAALADWAAAPAAAPPPLALLYAAARQPAVAVLTRTGSTPTGSVLGERPRSWSGRTRSTRRVLVAAAVAVVVAGGVAGVMLGPTAGSDPAARAAATLDLSGGAPMVLRRIADVTADAPGITPPRLDQFVYTKSVGVRAPRNAGRDYTGDPVPSQTQMWIAQDPTAASFIDFDGERVTSNPLPPDMPGPHVPTTYAEIAALPADPAQMRAYLDKLTNGDPFNGADLFRNAIVSPQVAAAVYRALADVPGLTVDSDVVDALGRPGIGISQTDTDGFRAELIFSPDGSRLLGKRNMWTRDYDSGEPGDLKGRAGQVVGDYAVAEQVVVDRAWEQPS